MTRHGFTLVEIMTSLAVLAVLLAACGSATLMATRAAGTGGARAQAQLQAADAVARVVEDLNLATNFTQRTARSVTFTVPDRLNAGTPQSVTYSWTGTAGDPLLRQFNNGAATAILPDARGLNFGYAARTLGPAVPTEINVYAQETAPALSSSSDYAVTDKKLAAQKFQPTLPAGTGTYTITRVRWLLKGVSQTAVIKVSIRLPDALNRPTATVLAETTVYGSALSTNTYEWLDIPFTNCTGLSPSQGLCVVLMPVTTGNLCAIQTDTAATSVLASSYWSTTTNGSTTFNASNWSTGGNLTCSRMSVYATVP